MQANAVALHVPLKSRIKFSLMMKVRNVKETKKMTQQELAEICGLTQPRISDLLKGKADLFSVGSLLDMCEKLGVDVGIVFDGVYPPGM